MLGKQIGETSGKRIVRRVLSTDPLKVEVSFEDSGKILGVATSGFATYQSVVGTDGSLYGEGAGAVISQEGDMASWKGSGRGQLKDKGALSYRGILYFQTTSKKLEPLNAVAVVFEYDVDPEGKTKTKMWEWK
jgi:hypothetical protein